MSHQVDRNGPLFGNQRGSDGPTWVWYDEVLSGVTSSLGTVGEVLTEAHLRNADELIRSRAQAAPSHVFPEELRRLVGATRKPAVADDHNI